MISNLFFATEELGIKYELARVMLCSQHKLQTYFIIPVIIHHQPIPRHEWTWWQRQTKLGVQAKLNQLSGIQKRLRLSMWDAT